MIVPVVPEETFVQANSPVVQLVKAAITNLLSAEAWIVVEVDVATIVNHPSSLSLFETQDAFTNPPSANEAGTEKLCVEQLAFIGKLVAPVQASDWAFINEV